MSALRVDDWFGAACELEGVVDVLREENAELRAMVWQLVEMLDRARDLQGFAAGLVNERWPSGGEQL